MHTSYLEIEPYLESLVREFAAIREIWLIGSRVNIAEFAPNDWDLLVFADSNTFESMRVKSFLKQNGIDVLVVKDKLNFEDPWHSPTKSRSLPKRGSLSNWSWVKKSEDHATYAGADWKTFEKGQIKECNAYRIYVKERGWKVLHQN